MKVIITSARAPGVMGCSASCKACNSTGQEYAVAEDDKWGPVPSDENGEADENPSELDQVPEGAWMIHLSSAYHALKPY